MLNIDLAGRRALVAGVADDGGFGFAIAKALAEAGASVCVATWPPALNIFRNLLERGKMDVSRRMHDGSLLEFEKVYPLDAAFDVLADAPDDVRTSKRYKDVGDFSARNRSMWSCTRSRTAPRSGSRSSKPRGLGISKPSA
jgi:enoyl-[acyl-carrier protein] reductase I